MEFVPFESPKKGFFESLQEMFYISNKKMSVIRNAVSDDELDWGEFVKNAIAYMGYDAKVVLVRCNDPVAWLINGTLVYHGGKYIHKSTIAYAKKYAAEKNIKSVFIIIEEFLSLDDEERNLAKRHGINILTKGDLFDSLYDKIMENQYNESLSRHQE